MLQNKQTTVYTKLYQKRNKNTKKNPGMKCALFNCKGEKGMDNSGYLNGLHYFTFCNEPAKNTLRHMYA